MLDAARPRYGGTLKLETTDSAAMRHVNALAYEGLVAIDASGVLRPALATSWNVEAGGTRWTFRLRHGVKLHDGSTLRPSQIADTLRAGHGDWQITTEGDGLTVDPGRAVPDLPWQLADPSNAIAIRQGTGTAVGSGPFRIERVEAGLIALRANDEYWDSRPFVDVVEVRTAGSAADQLTNVETGCAGPEARPLLAFKTLEQQLFLAPADQTGGREWAGPHRRPAVDRQLRIVETAL